MCGIGYLSLQNVSASSPVNDNDAGNEASLPEEMKEDIEMIKGLVQRKWRKKRKLKVLKLLDDLSAKAERCVVRPEGCSAGWSAYENSCYYIDNSPTQKMSDARLKCQNMGGDLVIIRSAQENDFIFDLVKKLNKGVGVWLGLQRKADSKFYWIDDTPVEGHYQNWAQGEPNDHGGREDCGHMYGKGSAAGKWNDSPCDWEVVPSVVCQKSM